MVSVNPPENLDDLSAGERSRAFAREQDRLDNERLGVPPPFSGPIWDRWFASTAHLPRNNKPENVVITIHPDT